MTAVLKELWPFIIEFFFKNEDVRKAVRSPKSIFKGFIYLAITFIILSTIYIVFAVVVDNVVYRNKNLSTEMLNLDKNYWELSNRYKAIYKQNNELMGKQLEVEAKIKELVETVNNQKITNRYLTELINRCTDNLDPETLKNFDFNPSKYTFAIYEKVLEELKKDENKTVIDLLKEIE